MDKSILAGFISAVLGTSAQASLTSVNVTSLTFTSNYSAAGTLFDDATGAISSMSSKFGSPWSATPSVFFDGTGTPSTWAGASLQGAYNYQFTLSAGQVAWGVTDQLMEPPMFALKAPRQSAISAFRTG